MENMGRLIHMSEFGNVLRTDVARRLRALLRMVLWERSIQLKSYI